MICVDAMILNNNNGLVMYIYIFIIYYITRIAHTCALEKSNHVSLCNLTSHSLTYQTCQ